MHIFRFWCRTHRKTPQLPTLHVRHSPCTLPELMWEKGRAPRTAISQFAMAPGSAQLDRTPGGADQFVLRHCMLRPRGTRRTALLPHQLWRRGWPVTKVSRVKLGGLAVLMACIHCGAEGFICDLDDRAPVHKEVQEWHQRRSQRRICSRLPASRPTPSE